MTTSLRYQLPSNEAQILSNSLSNLTLGVPVNKDRPFVSNYLKQGPANQYLGAGTAVNATSAPDAFNTGSRITLFEDVVSDLNGLIDQSYSQVNTERIGLYGPFIDGTDGNGQYLPSLDAYYPDLRAKITFNNVQGIARRVALPGSQENIDLNQQGLAVGNVYIQNPFKTRATYVRAGSKGWLDQLRDYQNGIVNADPDLALHFIAQAFVYGLAPVAQKYGIDVYPKRQDTTNGFNTVLYGISRNGSEINNAAQWIASNKDLLNEANRYYNQYLLSADSKKLGQYGSTNLFLKNSRYANVRKGQSQADPDAVTNQITTRWRNGERSVKGVAHWVKNKNSGPKRRGLTYSPLTDENGNPIPENQRYSSDGYCTLQSSGPYVTGSGAFGMGDGYLLDARKVNHRNRKGTFTAPTYKCDGVPNFAINPQREVYNSIAQGGTRTSPNADFRQMSDAISTWSGNANVSGDAVAARYADWVNDPEKYGTNPAFMLVPETGAVGFAKYAPTKNRPYVGENLINNEIGAGSKQRREFQQAQEALGGRAITPRFKGKSTSNY